LLCVKKKKITIECLFIGALANTNIIILIDRHKFFFIYKYILFKNFSIGNLNKISYFNIKIQHAVAQLLIGTQNNFESQNLQEVVLGLSFG